MKTQATVAIALAFLAVLGGCAPSLAGGSYTRDQAQREQSARLGVVESGRLIAVTQAADEDFRPGDRVRVLSDGYTARVTR